ncbi:MAG TPA: sugar transferase [Rhodothermales bacterium]|nr:sugar transferase [Rhodothermales bacterium]
MKILYLHQYFVTPDGSGGTRSYEMARRFVEAGHEVHVVTSARETRDGISGWTESLVEGVHVHALPVPYSNRMSYTRRMGAFASFALRAGARAAEIGGDVVFATSTPLTIAVPGVYAARRLDVPMVFEVRDLWPELPVAMGALKNPALIAAAEALERFAYRNAAHVVALSPGMRDGVIRAGYPARDVTVVPNGADVGTFRNPEGGAEAFLATRPHLRGKKLVVYTGTLGPINGVDYLVDVAAAARAQGHDSLHFLVLGDGRERERVLAHARETGVLGVNFELEAPVPKAEVPNVLAAASVACSLFVDLPAMRHNSANKFFDALAAARPVLINYEGWQAALLRESGAGIVAPPADPARTAADLAALVHDDTRLAAMGAAAADLADRNFDRDRLAAQLLRTLEAAVEAPAAVPVAEPVFAPVAAPVAVPGTLIRARADRPARPGLRPRRPARRAAPQGFYATHGKRWLDAALALVGLVVLSPVMLAVALAVRVGIGGPVLFRQPRPGRHGVPFTLVKFRTMTDARDAAGRPLADAERLTALGQFLRSTSLDELPELWNVLRGDMSLVGPRPLLTQYLDRYTPEQAQRHDVRPGLTGWAQVNGRNAVTWEERFARDVWYVHNASLAVDLRVLASTVAAVVGREGVSAEAHATMPEFTGSPEGAAVAV